MGRFKLVTIVVRIIPLAHSGRPKSNGYPVSPCSDLTNGPYIPQCILGKTEIDPAQICCGANYSRPWKSDCGMCVRMYAKGTYEHLVSFCSAVEKPMMRKCVKL